MADFGSRWENHGNFREGGQAHTFKVIDKDDPARPIRILKRLRIQSEATDSIRRSRRAWYLNIRIFFRSWIMEF